MKVLIIGGSGFVGSHIADIFLFKKWNVTVFDRQTEMYRQQISEITFEIGDFRNRGQLENIISREFDVVVHSLSTTTPKTSNDDPEFDISSNLIETVHLLELCRYHKVGKLIYLSSGGSIYGDSDMDSHFETDPVFPICSYAITKLAVEKYIYMYHKLHGLNYSILRISNPYGPRQNPLLHQGVISVFAYKMLSGTALQIWGDGNVIRDYIYVSDVALACYQAATVPLDGMFNIGSGIGISLNMIIKQLGEVTNSVPDITWLPARRLDVKKVVLDCSNAKTNLCWEPLISMEVGLKETVSWLTEFKDAHR